MVFIGFAQGACVDFEEGEGGWREYNSSILSRTLWLASAEGVLSRSAVIPLTPYNYMYCKPPYRKRRKLCGSFIARFNG